MNAFVLAGGQSTRMGRDKALIEFHGRPLIEHALVKLRALGFAPAIIGNRFDLEKYSRIVPDNYPGSGPLAGIETGLSVSDADLNLFLPVDLPLLPIEFLRWMVIRALESSALATIPRLQGHPQPLCAIYHKALLPHVRASLAAGDGKVMRAIEKASAAIRSKIDAFDVETIAASMPSSAWPSAPTLHRWFQNLNTPADVEFAALEESPIIY
jgi:molybdenum cofactor guanylyltransferase